SLFPSCRIAYLVLPNKLLSTYNQLNNKEGNTVPAHTQKIVANFMKSGSFERHLNKMRNVYRHKLTTILNALMQYQFKLKIDGAIAGNNFTVKVKDRLTMKQYLENDKKNKLNIIPFS